MSWVLADMVTDLTVETTPTRDVAGLVVGEGSTMLWQASRLNLVIENSTFLQFKQGYVIPTLQDETQSKHICLTGEGVSLYIYKSSIYSAAVQQKLSG